MAIQSECNRPSVVMKGGGREGGGRTRSRPRNKLSPSPALYSIKSFLFPVVDNENILSLYTTFFFFSGRRLRSLYCEQLRVCITGHSVELSFTLFPPRRARMETVQIPTTKNMTTFSPFYFRLASLLSPITKPIEYFIRFSCLKCTQQLVPNPLIFHTIFLLLLFHAALFSRRFFHAIGKPFSST